MASISLPHTVYIIKYLFICVSLQCLYWIAKNVASKSSFKTAPKKLEGSGGSERSNCYNFDSILSVKVKPEKKKEKKNWIAFVKNWISKSYVCMYVDFEPNTIWTKI